MNGPHIVAIIQARMGSTRFPGKVLKEIAGRPLLWHIVERLKHSRRIGKIAVATSTNPLDDAIVAFGEAHGIAVVRGPEDNVLARFALAAEAFNADIIVRVSSDAPFIEAGFIDHLLDAMIAQNGDYVLLEDGAVTAHEGVDPFSRRALDRLMMDAASDPVAREHVTGYFKLHPDFVSIARAPAYPAFAREGGRLTIDTPDDLAFAQAVHERLGAPAGTASLDDLLALLAREPSLRDLNAHVRQKSLAQEAGHVLIRCDGGGRYGYGHIKRTLTLARALRDGEGYGVTFAMNGTADALAPIRRAGFKAVPINASDDTREVAKLICQFRPDILVCDMRDGLDRAGLDVLAKRVALTAVIDDGSDRRLAADRAYYPPVPQARALSWEGTHCVARIGWEWALLGLQKAPDRPRPLPGRPTLLVAMGGSDPAGLTLKTASMLSKLDGIVRVRFVIGQGMENRERAARTIVGLSPNFETIEGADDLTTEYASADLALIAYGVTAFELASMGVPALYLCLTPDHGLSASAFDAAGIGQSLGLAEDVREEKVLKQVRALLSDADLRRRMRKAGMNAIDGKGAARIAADLSRALSEVRSTNFYQAAQ